jgi:hypothetical protein
VPNGANWGLWLTVFWLGAAWCAARRPGRYEFIVESDTTYMLLAFVDRNGDLVHQPGEPIGVYDDYRQIGHGVDLAHLDIQIVGAGRFLVPTSRPPDAVSRSLHLGEVAPLDDPRFGRDLAELGLWQPLEFMRAHGGGLWLLEPYDPERTPVVFLHGMGGYPQQFAALIDGLSDGPFQPWVVHYPSGWRLSDIARYLHRGLDELQARLAFPGLCMVAHSMGGLVARAMLSHHQAAHPRPFVRLIVTIASPLAGHPAAASGVAASPWVVPSWRDLAPGADFLAGLPAEPLHPAMRYVLFATTRDETVPIWSQLREEAQDEADAFRAFPVGHVEVLESEDVGTRLRRELVRCRADIEAGPPPVSSPAAP